MTTTHFAPAERAEAEELALQVKRVLEHPLLVTLLESFPDPVVILNRQRQIVAANEKLARLTGIACSALVGMRPGEALHCEHARDLPAGCGTTEFCKYCGAVNAIVNSQQRGQVDIQECRVCREGPEGPAALDLRVWATPMTVADDPLTVFAVKDITDEKRRYVLERMFFHDVLNSASGLRGLLDLCSDVDAAEEKELKTLARNLAGQLLEEIESQRDLAAAERGDLVVTHAPVDVTTLVTPLCQLYSHHTVAHGKHLARPQFSGPTSIHTAEVLLRRVLGNLIKNALEASAPGQTVTVTYRNDGVPTFLVHNESAMPEAVQRQMFQRSFTTKGGVGRGVGSYSVKLLTERYLGGTVSFTSSPEGGTTFTVRLPSRMRSEPGA